MPLDKHMKALELPKILELLAGKTTCSVSAQRARELEPSTDRKEVMNAIARTADINSLSVRFGTPSLGGIHDCVADFRLAARGGRLSIPQLIHCGRVLKTIRTIKDWRHEAEGPCAADDLFEMLTPCRSIEEELDRAILNEDELADTASPELADIRRNMKRAQSRIREQLDHIIHSSSYSKFLQDAIITMRDGRFVVPVKAEYRSEVKGLVHDTSSSGATVFIEPVSVVEANNEIRILEGREKQEIDRVLLELSGHVGQVADSAVEGFDALVELDLLFAKSRLADEMRASVPEISEKHEFRLVKARHPLIDKKKVVPVDIAMGKDFDTLVITGPNTGGKTVVLKTLGLLTLMAACGMMLPVASGSVIPVFEHVLADIGDEQSIEQSLSTFSAHITNIISILDVADCNSLVLIDELGAGTDPVEGAALAVSIIEKLRQYGSTIAATTHYAEIKMYALNTPGVENGSCEFSVETLSPTYRLLIGVPGRSNAFAISSRLGLADDVIDRAKELVSTENARFEDVVDRLEAARQELEKEQTEAMSNRQQAEMLRKQIEAEKQKLYAQMDAEMAKAREEAQTLVERVKSQTDLLLNEMEELKKEKDKEDFSSRVGKVRQGYKGRIEKLRDMADPVARRREAATQFSGTFKPNSTVLLVDLNTEGTVLSGPDSNGYYQVMAGIIRTKVKGDQLRPVDTANRKVTLNNQRRTVKKSRLDSVAEAVTTSVDIRGMSCEEGIIEVDRFLDRCVLSNLGTVTIIHGKGTGVLRTAIQAHLRKHPNVRTFRPGVYGEGEAGVTVVELK